MNNSPKTFKDKLILKSPKHIRISKKYSLLSNSIKLDQNPHFETMGIKKELNEVKTNSKKTELESCHTDKVAFKTIISKRRKDKRQNS